MFVRARVSRCVCSCAHCTYLTAAEASVPSYHEHTCSATSVEPLIGWCSVPLIGWRVPLHRRRGTFCCLQFICSSLHTKCVFILIQHLHYNYLEICFLEYTDVYLRRQTIYLLQNCYQQLCVFHYFQLCPLVLIIYHTQFSLFNYYCCIISLSRIHVH